MHIWEAAIHLRPEEYPIAVGDRLVSRKDLLASIYQILTEDPSRITDRKLIPRLRSLCEELEIDENTPTYDSVLRELEIDALLDVMQDNEEDNDNE
jgi:hypothetical protein